MEDPLACSYWHLLFYFVKVLTQYILNSCKEMFYNDNEMPTEDRQAIVCEINDDFFAAVFSEYASVAIVKIL